RPAFRPVRRVAEIEQAVRGASGPVMLDVYADWCVECKHLERETFAAPAVAGRLAGYTLLRADVTANDAVDRELLAHFGLYGPPAVLFFHGGTERRAQRLVGFVDAAGFTRLLDDLEQP
ncbi:MAG: thioredoxin family protein, partial [Gammaproteobacteria bacterium]|nr:thioredoxin family protein [Gammaproteobacteria bacterium]